MRGAYTPLYASPQQQQGEPPDPRDDVHALGVIWYQLVANDLQLTSIPPDWRDEVAEHGLQDDFAHTLALCITSKAERRLPDAGELAARLAALLEPKAAAPTPVAPPPLPPALPTELKPEPEPPTPAVTLPEDRNAVGMVFVTVPAGTSWIGGGGGIPGDKQMAVEEFQIAIHPVTQEQWEAVMGTRPFTFSKIRGGKHFLRDVSDADLKRFPAEGVSWDDVQQFLARLNKNEKSGAWLYRLSTEAEWEYACRGGATSQEDCSFHFYFDDALTNDLSSVQANFDGHYPDGKAAKWAHLKLPTKVGSYRPNRLGIYDMHGNVWEWCEDPHEGKVDRVLRGGSWLNSGQNCRASYRIGMSPSSRRNNVGFRVVRIASGA